MVRPREPIPEEMQDAHLLAVTGWTPTELDNVGEERLALFLLYKAVRHVREHGGRLF